MDFGKLDTNHMGWLWIKLQHFSQLHYDLELVLLKIINNEKYLHRIRMIARKKMHFFETVFKTTNHPQKPHGHKMKRIWSLICGAFKHSSSKRFSFRLYFWDKQKIHENTWFGATKKTVQTYLHWSKVQEK